MDRLIKKKMYIVESNRSGPDSTLPAIQFRPRSFVELAGDAEVKSILYWSDGNFGIIQDGVLYWTNMVGIKTLREMVRFFRIAGEFIDKIPSENFSGLNKIITAMNISNLNELISKDKELDYMLSTGLIDIKIDGREVNAWDKLKNEIFESTMDDVEVKMYVSLNEAAWCAKEKIKTFDECILRQRYKLSLNDYVILKHIPELFSGFDEVEFYDKPEIEENRVIIGKRKYMDKVFFAELFPVMDRYINTLRDFKKLYNSGKIKGYGEYLLLKKKQYTLNDFKDLISEGLVRIKNNGIFKKVIDIYIENEDIYVVDESGNKYSIVDLLLPGSPELTMPLAGNYRNYKSTKYRYYVEWKMIRNGGRFTDHVPKSLDELKQLIALNLVKWNNKTINDIKIHGKEVFLVLEDGTELPMYPLVSSRNEFEIVTLANGSLSWIRRFIAEGFGEKDALRLVLAIKNREMAKKDRIQLQELSGETGIPINRLEIYLTSDKFKRFGELRGKMFVLHPDIEEFKKSVKVRHDNDYQYIVVDGRNVMYGGEEKEEKRGKVGNIITLVDNLKKRGVPEDKIKVIVKNADFNKHRVDDMETLRDLEDRGIISAVSYGYDDMEILHMALEELNALIITNDKYREFIGGNIAPEDIENRRIEYTFRGKQFHIRKGSLSKLEKFIERVKERVQNKDDESSK